MVLEELFALEFWEQEIWRVFIKGGSFCYRKYGSNDNLTYSQLQSPRQ